ncbi:hypothetical protein P170DRAFT_436922 [Aspergillus steynii IBT 23096]|uniref:Uncharacterized protein n=1 Tax=Aspergillus steynii IBT 23096 TaxID=1392250 RepID=A0A2I2G8X4_9EURO|nr:uncharacterized protein P170DRAFT_436922 [Aspergillus steynii IBT 23096]PLB49330.1 hypothetical protein P170DRAFT_436922 [Aspergillus steynii IBT 23096]
MNLLPGASRTSRTTVNTSGPASTDPVALSESAHSSDKKTEACLIKPHALLTTNSRARHAL